MDIDKILSELRSESERIDEAIQMLERLAARKGRRRGRPPAWLKESLSAEIGEQGKAVSPRKAFPPLTKKPKPGPPHDPEKT